MRLSPINIILTGLAFLVLAGSALAQTDLSGMLGIDLENYIFSNSLKDTTRAYSVDRKLSNHFLRLNITGPVVNEIFATYSASAKFYGTYYHVSTDDGKTSQYITPNINSYSANLSLLPQRPYPLHVYLNRSSGHSLRYEATNKSLSDAVNPELAIIRRYFSETAARGAIWKMAFSENLNADIEVRRNEMTTQRRYDFDENRDIWVVYRNLTYDPISAIDTVQLVNSIPDDSLIFYIDLILVDTLAPLETVVVEIDSGYHDIEIVPLKYNSYRKRVRVEGDMEWEVLYTPPPSPNDLDQAINSVASNIRIGNNGDFTDEVFLEYNDTRENVQGMIIKLGNFTNTAKYNIRDDINVQALTSYRKNDVTIDTISSQSNIALMHQTALNYSKNRKFAASLSHSFNSSTNKTELSEINSKTNMFSNRFYVPFKTLNYEFDVNNSATLIADNTGHTNNQYGTKITNSISFELPGLLLAPKNEFKYGYNKQKKPEQSGTSLEDKFIVSGDAPGLRFLAELKFKGEMGWRKISSAGNSNTQKRYALNVNMNRQIVKGLKLGISSIQEKETYGGSSPTPGRNRDQRSPAREDQGLSSYQFDLQLNPMKDFSITANYTLINQNSSDISKSSISMFFTIPKIDIPVKSILVMQTRNLEGLPKQTQFIWENKASYRFRRVVLVVSHSMIEEDLLNEKYKFHEIQAEISRQFEIF